MTDDLGCLSFLDFLHNPEPLPYIKKDTNSKCGISLSIIFFVAYIAYEIFLIIDYKNDYKLTYSQDFLKSKLGVDRKLTFGFRLPDMYNDSIRLIFFNSSHRLIDEKLIKRCGPNLEERKGKSFSNDFFCFIDYPITDNNFNDIYFEVLISYEGEIKNNRSDVNLYIDLIEPRLQHNNDNPFDYSEVTEFMYIFNTGSTTLYEKYLKIIDYKTEGFFRSYENSAAYLDEYEHFDKIERDRKQLGIIGDIRFKLSKKRAVYERKYIGCLEYLISKVIGYFISIKGLFVFLTIILVNPMDKLRIFTSVIRKKPSLFNDSSNLIKDYYYKKNNEIPSDNNQIIIQKDFNFCDKVGLFCKCCRKNKKKALIAVNDYIEDKLTISNTLENTIINDKKYDIIKRRIDSINIPNDFNGREYDYIENQLRNEFPDYITEEIKVKIKEIIEEKYKQRIIGGGEMQ